MFVIGAAGDTVAEEFVGDIAASIQRIRVRLEFN